MSPDRHGYAARQTQLLAALVNGAALPQGFNPHDARAAAQSLRTKRARAVKSTWPALANELGDTFTDRFDAYARQTTGPPANGGATADGLAFAATIEQPHSDAVHVELTFARALLARRPFLATIRLHEPHRVLIVLRTPRGHPRHLALPLGR